MTNLIVGAVIFFLGLTLESITSWKAIRGARKHHPKLWAHSGEPTLLGNGDLTKAWPLVKYYRDRMYRQEIHRGETVLPPVTDDAALAFAESVRAPLVYTYYFAWICTPLAVLVILTAAI